MRGDPTALVVHACVDEDFYYATYPDVGDAGRQASRHFVEQGWREGRMPNAWFDTSWYAEQNADVTTSDLNPLEHYVRWGWREGRPTHPSPSVQAVIEEARRSAVIEVCPLLLVLAGGAGREAPR